MFDVTRTKYDSLAFNGNHDGLQNIPNASETI